MRGLMKSDKLLSILKLEILLKPLVELHLFFETSTTKLSVVYPALLRTLCQYYCLSHHPEFNTKEWLFAVVEIMVQLFNYMLTGSCGQLFELSFCISNVGRILLKNGKICSAFDLQNTLPESQKIITDLMSQHRPLDSLRLIW